MPDTAFDLASLIRPVEAADFLRDYWEKDLLAISRSDAGYFASLFSLADVDPLIAFTRPKFLDRRAFDTDPGSPNFVQGLLADDEPADGALYPDLSDVRRAFDRGKTVILTALQHRWPPVAQLCRRLEALFGCPVHTNLYLTPPGARGFAAHFDPHEVFALQIAGSKHWSFYGPARELPLSGEEATIPDDQLGPPVREIVLRPGDTLYLPRGHVHSAHTSDELSLHLTVGVKVFRWIDVLREALAQAGARDVRLRQSLPPGWLAGRADPDSLRDKMRELFLALAESSSLEDALDRLAGDFLARLAPLPADHFAPEGALELDTPVEHAPGVVCRIARLPGGRVSLQFPGGSLQGPAKVASALHFVARTPRFTPRNLPDDLTPDARLVLVRRLLRDRCLVARPRLD